MSDLDANTDVVFQRIDAFVDTLEEEGYPFPFLIEILREYVEIADDFML